MLANDALSRILQLVMASQSNTNFHFASFAFVASPRYQADACAFFSDTQGGDVSTCGLWGLPLHVSKVQHKQISLRPSCSIFTTKQVNLIAHKSALHSKNFTALRAAMVTSVVSHYTSRNSLVSMRFVPIAGADVMR